MNQKPLGQWVEPFLASLRIVPVITRACEAAGISHSAAWQRRQKDPEFKAAWDEAIEAGIDRAEQEAFRRAVDGTQKAVWHNGVQVGVENVYSDALMSLVLRGRRRRVYGDRTEIAGDGGGALKIESTTPTEMARKVAFLLASGSKAVSDLNEDPTPGSDLV